MCEGQGEGRDTEPGPLSLHPGVAGATGVRTVLTTCRRPLAWNRPVDGRRFVRSTLRCGCRSLGVDQICNRRRHQAWFRSVAARRPDRRVSRVAAPRRPGGRCDTHIRPPSSRASWFSPCRGPEQVGSGDPTSGGRQRRQPHRDRHVKTSSRCSGATSHGRIARACCGYPGPMPTNRKTRSRFDRSRHGPDEVPSSWPRAASWGLSTPTSPSALSGRRRRCSRIPHPCRSSGT